MTAKPLTRARRRPDPDAVRLRFLLSEFIEVPDEMSNRVAGTAVEEELTDAEWLARAKPHPLRERTARVLLPGPPTGAYSLPQLALIGLPERAFVQLRRDVRDWLRSMVVSSHVPPPRTLTVRRSLVRLPDKRGALQFVHEGPAADVLWYYIENLIFRMGLSRIGVCRAPKSKREQDPEQRETRGGERCGRLFLRRGKAKEYCSARCRVRLAKRRERSKQR